MPEIDVRPLAMTEEAWALRKSAWEEEKAKLVQRIAESVAAANFLGGGLGRRACVLFVWAGLNVVCVCVSRGRGLRVSGCAARLAKEKDALGHEADQWRQRSTSAATGVFQLPEARPVFA
jgi:hypothetical protein